MRFGFKATVFSFIILAGQVFSQSVYSQYGLGQLNSSSSVRNSGAAGTGLGLFESDAINTQNFASLTSVDITRFEVSAAMNAMFMKTDQAKKYYSRIDFSGFSLAFPVYKPYGIGMAMGLLPYSSINFESKKTLQHAELGSYTQQFLGSGGLSKLYMALSYRFPFDLRFSTAYHYVFGRSEYNSVIKFSNSNYSKSDYAEQIDLFGSALSFGFISPDLKSIVSAENLSSLRIGLNIDYFTKLNTDYKNLAISSYVSETVDSYNGKTEIPPRISVGLSGMLKNNMTINLDYSSQAWSNFKRFDAKDGFLRNASRVGAGVIYRTPRSAGYDSERWIYRAGISYEQTPIVIAGTNIDQLNISAGISVPMSRNNFIETALTYSMRGKTASNLIQENLFKLDISLSFGEFWFIQQER